MLRTRAQKLQKFVDERSEILGMARALLESQERSAALLKEGCREALCELSALRSQEPPSMRLTPAQERELVEFAEKNDNPENEWCIGGRGRVAACNSLVHLGLAKRHHECGELRVYSLTDAGRKLHAEHQARSAR